MAKVKFDLSGVDAGGGSFETPDPGMYQAKVREVNPKKSKAGNNMLEVIVEITKDSRGKKTKFKSSRIWHYVTLTDEAAFRYREFTDAVGITKPGAKKAKGTLDTDAVAGTIVLINVKHEPYEGEQRAKIARLLPLPENEEEGEDEDNEDAAKEEDDEDDDDDDDAEDDEDDDEDEEDDDDDEDEEDFSSMSLPDLREAAEKAGLDKQGKKAELIERLEENAEDDDDDDDDDDDYDEWSITELKEELKNRELNSKGNKKNVLIARLRKDDEDEEDPF